MFNTKSDINSMCCSQTKAFTLIELLVVISIISLLISILLPALRAARESAKQIKCLSQIRQMNNSMMFYTEDYDGWFPTATNDPSYYGYNTSIVANQSIKDNKLAPYNCDTYSSYTNASNYVVNPAIQCPNESNHNNNNSTYWIPGPITAGARYIGYYANGVWPRVQDLLIPTKVLTIYEGSLFHATSIPQGTGYQVNNVPNPYAGEFINAMRLDGHGGIWTIPEHNVVGEPSVKLQYYWYHTTKRTHEP